MDGPWSKYQKPAVKPWEKYGKGTQSQAMTEGLAQLSDMTRNPPPPEKGAMDYIRPGATWLMDRIVPGMGAYTDAALGPAPQPGQQSVGQAIYGNVVGNPNDGITNTGEALGTWLSRGGESMTLGVAGDELNALTYGMLPGRSYDGELDRFRKNEEGMSGAGRLSADIVGGIIPALTGAGALASAPSLAGRMGYGAVMGGGAGGLMGFMEGEGGLENRLKSARAGGLGGAVVGGAIPVAGNLLRKGAEGIANSRAIKDFIKTAPSVDDLIAQAGAKYDEARALGVTATADDTTKLAGNMAGVLAEEGLYSPTGRISSAYPKVNDALSMIIDYANGAMDPTQMQQVRKLLQGVAKSSDGQEARIGTKMLKIFDDFVAPLAPQFKEANALYASAMKGDMIDTAIELAGSRAGQFSGSGFENALRTEFRALDRKIIKGELKGLTERQIAAIKRVANGGSMENILRDLGKMAPRGVVSTAAVTGVPYAIGTSIGGPAVGAAMSAGALGLGEIGRRGATAMQTKNALLASALMRAGGNAVAALEPASRARLEAIANALGFAGLPRGGETVGNALLGR